MSSTTEFLYVPLQESSSEGHGAIKLDTKGLPDANDVLGVLQHLYPFVGRRVGPSWLARSSLRRGRRIFSEHDLSSLSNYSA